MFVCKHSLAETGPEVQPVLGEKVLCTALSPHLYILSYVHVHFYPPLWQLHSDFRNFSHEAYYVMKMADSNPYMGLFDTTFCFSSNVLAGASKILIMTMSLARIACQ